MKGETLEKSIISNKLFTVHQNSGPGVHYLHSFKSVRYVNLWRMTLSGKGVPLLGIYLLTSIQGQKVLL